MMTRIANIPITLKLCIVCFCVIHVLVVVGMRGVLYSLYGA